LSFHFLPLKNLHQTPNDNPDYPCAKKGHKPDKWYDHLPKVKGWGVGGKSIRLRIIQRRRRRGVRRIDERVLWGGGVIT